MSAGTKRTKILICGANGRMGTRILALAKADATFQVVGAVDRRGQLGGSSSIPFVSDAMDVIRQTDVVIDFTTAEAVMSIALQAATAKKALVVGTTGLTPLSLKKLQALGKKIPIVFSPNMSVGVNALFEIVKQVASKLPHYDIEIVEAHHNLKKDSPSGTAMRLAEIAAEASGRQRKDFVYGRQGFVGARSKKEISILAVRAGDIVGDHTVYLGGPGERLELTHRAHSRDAFAAGALRAAQWIKGRKPGFYSMIDVLKK